MATEKDAVPDPPKDTPADAPPHYGADAWLRVVGAWLLFMVAWGPAVAYGSFQLYYESTLLPTHSASQLSWIGSMSAFLLVCTGAFAGPFFDRGYLKSILVLGCSMIVFSLMMLSLSTSYYQLFLAQGICYGMGAGLVYVPALALTTGSFQMPTRAYAAGIVATGASVGGIVFPIMFLKLEPRIGFPWLCRVFGFFTLGLSILGVALVWSAPTKVMPPRKLTEISAFTEPIYVSLALVFFLQFLGFWIPVAYIPTYARTTLNASQEVSIYMVAVFNAGSIFGRIVPAIAMARFGAINVVFAGTAATMVMLFAWIGVDSIAGYAVWCAITGFVTGVFISGNPVIVAHPLVSPLAVLGSRLGQLWLCAGLGALIGAPIGGALVEPTKGGFLHVQIFAGCIIALAVGFFVFPLLRLNRHGKE